MLHTINNPHHLLKSFSVTGYVRGGCTSIGMKKNYVTRVDISAMNFDSIYVSAGKIGVQLLLVSDDLLTANGGEYADIVRGE